MAPASAFERLVAPIPPAVFFADYWERRPVLVRRSAPSHYDDLLTLDDLDRHIRSGTSSHQFLELIERGNRMPHESWTRVRADGREPFRVVDVESLLDRMSRGATVLLTNSELAFPMISSFLEALAAELRCAAQANLYATPPQSQGFAPHADPHHIFVLQIHGEKSWRLDEASAPIVVWSVPVDGRPEERSEAGHEVEIHAGDLLYVPRGVVHSAETTESGSVHVTVGPLLETWAHVLRRLADAAAREPAFQRLAPHGLASPGERARFADEFVRGVHEFARDLDAEKVGAALAPDRPPVAVPRTLASVIAPPPLGLDSLVYTDPHAKLAVERSDDCVTVRVGPRRFSLPAILLAALESILSGVPLRVRDIVGVEDDAGKLALARRLLAEGVIVVEPPSRGGEPG